MLCTKECRLIKNSVYVINFVPKHPASAISKKSLLVSAILHIPLLHVIFLRIFCAALLLQYCTYILPCFLSAFIMFTYCILFVINFSRRLCLTVYCLNIPICSLCLYAYRIRTKLHLSVMNLTRQPCLSVYYWGTPIFWPPFFRLFGSWKETIFEQVCTRSMLAFKTTVVCCVSRSVM